MTDEFLKLYLARPELIPPPEACAVERTLHAALLADPRTAVAASDIAAIADADARENWQMLIAFRDHLLRHKTLEAAYADLVRRGIGDTPPLFVNQLVHVILRNALDGVNDARVLRAAELFFRTQRVTVHEGSLIAADEETIGGVNTAPVTPLVSMLGIPAEAEIDVINDDNADSYWQRSDQFDMALDLTGGRAGLVALAEAMRRWIAHVLGVEVTIEPLTNCASAAHLVCRSRRRRHQDRRPAVERRGTRRGGPVARGRAVPRSPSAIRRSCWTRSKASRSI